MKRALLAALTALLLFTPAAHAGWKIDYSKEVAQKVFPNRCGYVDVRWAVPGPAEPFSAWVAPGVPCAVYFNSNTSWDWYDMCTVMVHEYGHLYGMPHSSDPSNVMYPYLSFSVDYSSSGAILNVRGAYWACYDRGRWIRGLPPGGYGWT